MDEGKEEGQTLDNQTLNEQINKSFQTLYEVIDMGHTGKINIKDPKRARELFWENSSTIGLALGRDRSISQNRTALLFLNAMAEISSTPDEGLKLFNYTRPHINELTQILQTIESRSPSDYAQLLTRYLFTTALKADVSYKGEVIDIIISALSNREMRNMWNQNILGNDATSEQLHTAEINIERALRDEAKKREILDMPEDKTMENISLGLLTKQLLTSDAGTYFGVDKEGKRTYFPVQQLVRTPINSFKEFEERLTLFDAYPVPDTTNLRESAEVAEFVTIDKVVGGVDIGKWTEPSKKNNRGIENAYTLALNFQNRTADITGPNDPMKVIEVNGKYFVVGQGRHRVAALKALGIPFAPMLVTHYSR